jgi:hypothetical protein
MHDPVTSFVVAVFSMPGAALIAAAAILIFAVGLIVQSGHFEYAPLRDDLNRRAEMLGELTGDREKAFAEAFPAIDKRLSGMHVMGPTIDHQIPLALGGPDIVSNAVAAHRTCNTSKGTRYMPGGEQLALALPL